MTEEQHRTATAKRIRARWNRGLNERPLNISTPGAYPYGAVSPLNWWAAQMSADSALHYNLRTLIDKCQQLRLTNPYAEHIGHEMEANVLSSDGLTLQMQIKQDNEVTLRDGTTISAGEPDEGANMAIENAWWDFWHHKGNCDVTGELTGLDAEKLTLTGAVFEGTPLIRLIRGFDNEWGFAIQLLSVDSLDLNYNQVLDNGNEIRMAIERDNWGRRVAAWIAPYKPGEWQRGGNFARLSDRFRIPFEGFQERNNNRGTLLAPFLRKRSDQTLGWPWLTPVIDVLNCLMKYEEAELVATRAAAEKMGFFESTEGAEEFTGAQDESGNFVLNSVPGAIQSLPVGKHFVGWDPKHPNGNYGDYRKGVLRQIASGLGISYGSLANDRSDSSFSAERTALSDEREFYKMIQAWFIHQIEIPIFNAWLEMALLRSKIALENGSALPAAKIDKFNKPYFQGRRWGYINPQQEINADILAVNNGFKSRRQIVAENGGYIEDVFSEQAQDNRLAETYDLSFNEPAPKAPDSPLPDSVAKDGND
jgi:lambda family phage portal protein